MFWMRMPVVNMVLMGSLLAACQVSGPSPSPTTSATATRSATSTATPQPTVLPFPVTELPPNSLALVAEDLPILIGQPGGGGSIETLAAGTEIVILQGPRDFEGNTMYEFVPADCNSCRVQWLRVDIPTALVPVNEACPDASDAAVGTMLAWDRVRCFGQQTLTFEGEVNHCQGGVVAAEPEWLAYSCWGVSYGGGGWGLHATPQSGIVFPDDLVRARLTGHVDDPASATCRTVDDMFLPPSPSWNEPGDAEQILLCREGFVVDTFEILEVIDRPSQGG